MTRRRLLGLAWTAAGLLFGLVVLRAFLGDVFSVRSGSMRPTLWGRAEGREYVLVTFGGTDSIRRFDLVVLRRDGEPEPFVKRVCGLGDESVQIRGGDLWIDDEILAAGAPRPPLVALYEHGSDDRGAFGHFWLEPEPDVWTVGTTEITIRAPAAEPERELSQPLRERVLLTDGWIDPDGNLVAGTTEVNDLALEVELFAVTSRPSSDGGGTGTTGPCGSLVLALTEEADEFALRVQYAPGAAELVLLRRGAGLTDLELGRTTVEIDRDGWQALGLANVDDHLEVAWNGAPVLAHDYGGNRPLQPPRGSAQVHRKPRLTLAGGGKDAIRLRGLRVLRDVYWTQNGRFGTQEPLELAPDELLLLGDCSAQSTDGRTWAGVRRADLLGRPRAVIWPPARIRRLRPRGPESD